MFTPLRVSSVVLMLLSFTLPGFAQMSPGVRVEGSVVDETSDQPLAQATVAFYDGDAFVTGTATDTDGAFAIEVQPATYRIRISFIGYESEERDEVSIQRGKPVDLGSIRLAEDTAVLGEAQVEAERELVEQRADRTVYNLAAQPVTTGGSALEALQTLPSIEVDTDGNLSLRGGQNVAVHLNGRPVPVRGAMLTAMLRQIPASKVERVEVLPNPSARYEPDGMSGIINIVLKQGTNRGLSGGITAGGGTAPSAELSGNVAYQKGKVDVYGSYGFRYDAFGMDGTSTRVRFLDAGNSTIDQSLELDNGTYSHLFNGTLDYALTEKTTLGVSGTFGVRDGSADQFVGYRFEPDAPSEQQSDRLTDGAVSGLNADAALTFRHQFDGDTHKLTAETRMTRNTGERDEQFIDRVLVPQGAETIDRSLADDLTDEAYAQLDYVVPFRGMKVEAGTKATLRHLDNDRHYEHRIDGSVIPDLGRMSDFRYDEGVYAGYAQATRTIGNLEFQAGLRGEIATRELAEGRSDEYFEDQFSSLYPSAFVLYTFAPGTSLKFSTSRRVNRPQAFFLNPAPRFEDTLIVDKGNPELRPEYTTAFEGTFQYKFFLTVTPFYRHTTDVIRRRILFDPATGSTTGTFQNLDTQDSYGLELTVTPTLGPVRAVLSSSAFRSITDGGSVETGLASDGFVWTLRGNIQAKLREGTDLQAFGFYRGPLEVEDGRISPFGFTSLGLSQQLGERLRLAVRVNDLLGTSEFKFKTGNGQYTFDGFRDPAMQQVSATFTYTFGSGQPRRPRPGQNQPQQGGLDGGVGF